jgi:hypothetical protein
MNTRQEIDDLVDALAEIAMGAAFRERAEEVRP